MPIRLSIDRFEGPKKQVAVLLTDDGTQFNVMDPVFWTSG
jgi:hypothetical protein